MAKNRIKELRNSANPKITLKELSEKLKEKGLSFTDSQLSKFENGTSTPRNNDIWKALADIFDVNPMYLLGYTDIKMGKIEANSIFSLLEDNIEFVANGGTIRFADGEQVNKESEVFKKWKSLKEEGNYYDKLEKVSNRIINSNIEAEENLLKVFRDIDFEKQTKLLNYALDLKKAQIYDELRKKEDE